MEKGGELKRNFDENENFPMMNTNDKDIDLGLTLNSTNFRIKTRQINTRRAGLNANWSADMALASTDPLSELVWSSKNGLSIKRANSSFVNKRPFLMWNVDPSNSSISRSDEKEIIIDANDKFGQNTTFPELSRSGAAENDDKTDEETGTRDDTRKDDIPQENLCCVKNAGLDNTISDGINGSKVDMAKSGPLSSNLIEKITHCNSHPLERSPTNSMIRLYREKGKQKVLSDDDEVENHESVEFSNIDGLLPKGVKRKNSNVQEMLEERQMTKRQIEENPGSRYRSSFMNWMSSMIKGPSDSYTADDVFVKNKDNDFICNKTRDSSSLNSGFQTIFESFRNNDNSCKQIVVSNKESRCAERAVIPFKNTAKINPVASLWITRLFTTDPTDQITQESREVNLDRRVDSICSIDQKDSEIRDNSVNIEESIDLKSSEKLEDLEAMGLVFSRHIIPSEIGISAEKETFDAIRKLRFSRADILRWINSNLCLSRLNGFFLRLRLGKSEAGSSYYVAWITGDTESVGCLSKKSILVDVGGIKSSVGIQYISNHDFMEDEIKAWCCTVVKSGLNVPSLDELSAKLNDRNQLRF